MTRKLEYYDNLYYDLSQKEKEEIIYTLYLCGNSMQQVADILEISKATVGRILQSLNNRDNNTTFKRK